MADIGLDGVVSPNSNDLPTQHSNYAQNWLDPLSNFMNVVKNEAVMQKQVYSSQVTQHVQQTQVAGLGDLINYFTGGGSPFSKDKPVQPNNPYPSREDAQQYKDLVSYGSGMEPQLQGNQLNILPRDMGGTSSQITDYVYKHLEDPKQLGYETRPTPTHNEEMGDMLTQTAIAANRNPITKLGFDPTRIGIDPDKELSSLTGLYSPSKDVIYSDMWGASTPTHESTHRGLEILRKAGVLSDKEKSFLSDHEESVVRYIMASQMGDPETQENKNAGLSENSVGNKEIARAKKIFNPHEWYDVSTQDTLNSIEQKAAELYAKKHPALGHR